MLLVTVFVALAVLANAERKKLIIDTDIFSAVDNVRVLAITNVFHNTVTHSLEVRRLLR